MVAPASLKYEVPSQAKPICTKVAASSVIIKVFCAFLANTMNPIGHATTRKNMPKPIHRNGSMAPANFAE
jgi:hypothetical protein